MDIEKTLLVKFLRELLILILIHNLSQSQQLMQTTDIQEEEIRISISLPYVEGTSEKLRGILRSHKIRITF